MAQFIVIEGIDGAGTSTQARRLAEALRDAGREVRETFEPTDGPVGLLIRSMLRKTEPPLPDPKAAKRLFARLFAADRHHHLHKPDDGVLSCLAANRDVVAARYVLSSLAYEGDDAIEQAFVLAQNAEFPTPDLTVYLDCPVSLALDRIRARGQTVELFENEAKLARVRAGYERALSGYPGVVLRLDAARAPEELTQDILSQIAR
ncbi:MAG TPA: dTMP kinase [Planctomycetes bacterium]|nr:dTMP kinase [Planctomycetota bacterium]